ncbi:MAG: phospholipid carrier-dependent glycosyltransferase [Deltaproteobacteria bacterium]|nr:phospholipid carrier-dependent glycosyltransferase [Deltaproteobacteria bacterium]
MSRLQLSIPFSAKALARIAVHLPVLLVFGFAVRVAWQGIDFGQHWDEHIIILAMQRSLRSGLFLPQRYNYPSVPFYLPYFALASDAFALWWADVSLPKAVQALVGVVQSHWFLLSCRRLFSALVLSSILWVYVLIYAWRRVWWEALLGAAILGLSFELGYHARWVAPDGVMMQFGALTMALLVVSRQALPGAPGSYLTAAAIAAGLTCGSKYPGGILLLPVLLAPLLDPRLRAKPWIAGLTVVKLGALFALAYLFTTPATLVDAFAFREQLDAVARVYKEEGHAGYTVIAGAPHFAKLLTYLGRVALSPFTSVAAVFAMAAAVGAVLLLMRERAMAVLLVGVPVLYVSYFSQTRVMIVRNLLILFPFLAVLAAYGLAESARAIATLAERRLPPAVVRAVLAVTLTSPLLFGAAYLQRAQATIQQRRQVDPIAALAGYLDQHPEERFGLSPDARRRLHAYDEKVRPNVVDEPSPETMVAVFPREISNWMWRLPANDLGSYRLLPTGPLDVSWDYYPSWMDANRLIFMRAAIAKNMGLKVTP